MGVEVEGEEYFQMHVDGGIYSHVFMVGLLVNWKEILGLDDHVRDDFDASLYVIANRKYRNNHQYHPVEQSPSSIISAYIEMETDLIFDRNIYRLYKSCMKKDIKFHMATVPEYENSVDDATEFNPGKMKKLFNTGYGYGLKGVKWQKRIAIDEYDRR